MLSTVFVTWMYSRICSNNVIIFSHSNIYIYIKIDSRRNCHAFVDSKIKTSKYNVTKYSAVSLKHGQFSTEFSQKHPIVRPLYGVICDLTLIYILLQSTHCGMKCRVISDCLITIVKCTNIRFYFTEYIRCLKVWLEPSQSHRMLGHLEGHLKTGAFNNIPQNISVWH